MIPQSLHGGNQAQVDKTADILGDDDLSGPNQFQLWWCWDDTGNCCATGLRENGEEQWGCLEI